MTARLTDYQNNPVLMPFYEQQKHILELAHEKYGMDEDAYLALWERVVVTVGASAEDIERYGYLVQAAQS